MDRWAWVLIAVVVMVVVYFFAGRTRRGPLAVVCPCCTALLPPVRMPSSLSETLSGGWTCKNCGCKVDRRGRERS
jgi:hypothetical protein